MKRSTTAGLFICFSFFFSNLTLSQEFKLIDNVLGDGWSGSLIYLDYSSQKVVKIPVTAIVEKGKGGRYAIRYMYPEEPRANNREKMTLDLETLTLGGDPIKSAETQIIDSDSVVCIKTVSRGKENGVMAEFYRTYVFGSSIFSITKEVQFEGSDEIILRNEYSFARPYQQAD